MSKKIFSYILLLVVGIIVGVFIQLTYAFPICFNPQIGLIDVLELFVTIFLGIYIARIIEKQIQDKRVEKDILLKRIEQIEFLIEEFEKIEIGVPQTYTQITHRISKAREKKNRMIKSIQQKTINNKLIHPQINEIQEKLKNDFKTLKLLLTNTPAQISNHPEVKIENGNIVYYESRLNEINATLFDVNDRLLELKLIVNSL